MKVVYSSWDEALASRLRELRGLRDLFNTLLLQLNGDVERALSVMSRLQELGYLDKDVDMDKFQEDLLREAIIEVSPRGRALTRKGERDLRRNALQKVFTALRKSGRGDHVVSQEGGGITDILPEKRAYEYGDSLERIDYTGALFNSITRSANLNLDITEEDFQVYETEKTTSCATALLLDISHSMILYGEDRITPAKQVAMAIAELITTRYPRDFLTVILFGDEAREVKVRDLPYCGVGPYHTNTRAGLAMARQILLKRKRANRRIIMITDGKPSAITRSDGSIYKNPIGLDPRIVNRTLDEAVICRRKRIDITTFMVTEDPYLRGFVEQLTELNRGQAFFSSLDRLGEFVISDFLTRRNKGR